jgi:hypothetical protein
MQGKSGLKVHRVLLQRTREPVVGSADEDASPECHLALAMETFDQACFISESLLNIEPAQLLTVSRTSQHVGAVHKLVYLTLKAP